jgi:hypothetical protein
MSRHSAGVGDVDACIPALLSKWRVIESLTTAEQCVCHVYVFKHALRS